MGSSRRPASPQAEFDRLRGPVTELAGRVGLALEPGRYVLELRPPGSDKGKAVRELAVQLSPAAVMFCGDDPGSKSSTLACDSQYTFQDACVPVLYPGDQQDVLDLGVHAFRMSRYCGAWVGLKIVTAVADGIGTVDLDPGRHHVVAVDDRRSPTELPRRAVAEPRLAEEHHKRSGGPRYRRHWLATLSGRVARAVTCSAQCTLECSCTTRRRSSSPSWHRVASDVCASRVIRSTNSPTSSGL